MMDERIKEGKDAYLECASDVLRNGLKLARWLVLYDTLMVSGSSVFPSMMLRNLILSMSSQ